ncbi:vestitone reductase-like [Prosopis cineraria]|uniref:vestitone reductase-like n=1 Tax=Prosopis cineraria TaxID=364024 RepID=UPI0024105F0D|nr:vestitone reductase-like [Prosopis cineraria]
MEVVDKGPVCVTGGNGFIGSWLIMRLLQQGYSVHTTVRSNPESNKDLSYLRNLPGAPERLQIFKADLEVPDSFKEAIEGCVGVFHVAHPMDMRGEQPEEVVTKWAVEGTQGILRTCLSSNTVKKLIFTSSLAAVMFKNFKGIETVDETIWSDLEIGRSSPALRSSYFVSKTLTEKAVLEFGKENETKLKVVSFVLPLVGGPFLAPKMPAAISLALSLILGDESQCKILRNTYMVHVEDVTRALIFLFENSNAKGRLICGFHQVTFQQLHQMISQKYPQYHIAIPDNFMGAKDNDKKKYPCLSYKKLRDTGFELRYGVEDIYDDAIKSCKDKGFL